MKSPNPSHHQPEDDFRTSNTLLQRKPELNGAHLGIESAGAFPKIKEDEDEVHHRNELRRLTTSFLNHVLSKEWSESSKAIFAEAVALHGRTFTRPGISSILSFFQACHSKLELKEFTIHNIHVDLEHCKSAVRGDLVYCTTHSGMERELTDGPCILHFELTSTGWHITHMEIPGM